MTSSSSHGDKGTSNTTLVQLLCMDKARGDTPHGRIVARTLMCVRVCARGILFSISFNFLNNTKCSKLFNQLISFFLNVHLVD